MQIFMQDIIDAMASAQVSQKQALKIIKIVHDNDDRRRHDMLAYKINKEREASRLAVGSYHFDEPGLLTPTN